MHIYFKIPFIIVLKYEILRENLINDVQILHTKLQNMTNRNTRIPKHKGRYILLMNWKNKYF